MYFPEHIIFYQVIKKYYYFQKDDGFRVSRQYFPEKELAGTKPAQPFLGPGTARFRPRHKKVTADLGLGCAHFVPRLCPT